MPLILIKIKKLIKEISGIEIPLLETAAHKGVLNAVISVMVASVVRTCYKAFDLVGTVLIRLAVRYPKEKDPLPPIGSRTLLRESVAVIAEKIRTGQVTAEEVVRTFIGRIHEVNGQINAMVDERFAMAIEEARRCDKLVASGELTTAEIRVKFPLLGVPFTIKDSFCIAGLKHTAGLYYRKDITAPEDADIVKVLKIAGAIPLGVTNVSELCMWWESFNTVYGRSKNAYDTRHITGGSSGGEASLQAASGSAFGVGSDIGGSIRMPSFFCGIYGHKPSIGLVPYVAGQEPQTTGRINDFLTTGPMVRCPEDLALILEVMAGENRDKLKPVPELKQIRILYMEDDGGSPMATPVSDELKEAMRKAMKFMETKHGVKAQQANISKLYYSLEMWAHAMSGAGAPTFCEELGLKQRKINPFWELIKYVFRRSPHTFPAIILGILEKAAYAGKVLPRHKEMIEMGFTLTKELQDLLRDDAILFYPTHPTPAPRHHKPMFRPADFSYAAIFNVLGVPVTQVPLGVGQNGLPLGVQVVGGLFSDRLTMRVAEELREAFGGWVSPCHDISDSGNLTTITN